MQIFRRHSHWQTVRRTRHQAIATGPAFRSHLDHSRQRELVLVFTAALNVESASKDSRLGTSRQLELVCTVLQRQLREFVQHEPGP